MMMKTIGIIDGDRMTARGIALLVEDMGHTAIVAATAGELLAALPRGTPPGLVIADQRAGPGRNGLSEAIMVRHALRRDLPVIVLAERLKSTPTHGLLPSKVAILHVPVDAATGIDMIAASLR